MEGEIDKLRRDLERYRRLHSPYGGITDRQLRNTLEEMIAEIEEKLRAIESGQAVRLPRHSA